MKLHQPLVACFLFLIFLGACALTATRPVQEMSDTTAAIRAAKEVQADSLAPEPYRQANEWFFKAQQEYKFKNFHYASEYALRARKFAEQAEFESIKNGGNRTDATPPESSQPEVKATPYDYPTPEGTPADVYQERKQAEEVKKAATAPQPQPQSTQNTGMPGNPLSPPAMGPGSGTP